MFLLGYGSDMIVGYLWLFLYVSNIMRKYKSRDLNQLTLITQLRHNHD